MNKSALGKALAKLARGKPKNFSPAERARRRALMEKINAAKKKRSRVTK